MGAVAGCAMKPDAGGKIRVAVESPRLRSRAVSASLCAIVRFTLDTLQCAKMEISCVD